jgi:hypothetical protein
MSGDSKFIQITTTSVVLDNGQIENELFALDEEGDIWRYDWRTRELQWIRLSTKRKK